MVDYSVNSERFTMTSYQVPGYEYILDYIVNVNYATALVIFYVDDIKGAVSTVGPNTALRTIKSMLCDELRIFYNTGNPSLIDSRLLLQVIEKRRNQESLVNALWEEACIKFALMDKLSYPEKTQRLVKEEETNALEDEESWELSRKPQIHGKKLPKKKTNAKLKKKKNNRKYKTLKIKKQVASNEKSFSESSLDDDEDPSLPIIKSTNINQARLYILKLGQFCYDIVLYPLLNALQMIEYTWRQVSEACCTAEGLDALARLGFNQSQVDICISIVRDRVPIAHPSKVGLVEVQDSLAILKTQHPRQGKVFDDLRHSLSASTGWNAVSGSSEGRVVDYEEAQIMAAVLLVGEFCLKDVFEPAASILGLSLESSSLFEIIEQTKANQGDVSLLIHCKRLIKLRNAYAHQGVSSAEAAEALKFIYGDAEPHKKFILEPLLQRASAMRSEGIEFY